jgi:hypothetical protein
MHKLLQMARKLIPLLMSNRGARKGGRRRH